ncbi:bacillithiol system redox-active protein YtxJ [Bacillus sp. JCM 19034]|uniref:bacillithiol system redox-active protein YtxJ n=1 Tax=Bacillus sp. JCM 19034 TaxID=1481928 RepID=UPI0007834CD8|nr:bacillithiol system redox-active protein YtxJ [Bacillus sp. JCM 19034]
MNEKVKELVSMDDWKVLLEKGTPTLLLKHSTTCPISAEAYNQFMAYVEGQNSDNNVEFALVKVIEMRPISNQIAEDLQLKHESPQCVYMKNQEVAWSATHWNVTEEAIKENVN